MAGRTGPDTGLVATEGSLSYELVQPQRVGQRTANTPVTGEVRCNAPYTLSMRDVDRGLVLSPHKAC